MNWREAHKCARCGGTILPVAVVSGDTELSCLNCGNALYEPTDETPDERPTRPHGKGWKA